MNNLHRELAPISGAAWAQIDEEASRTLKRHLAGRRVVDVHGPDGTRFSAVGTGHLRDIESPHQGILTRQREVAPLIEFRVPFRVSRSAVDDVERGAQDSDWQPVKDAARQIAFAEDRAVFEGYPAGQIGGIRASSSNQAMTLPADVLSYPEAIAEALRHLREAGVNGPYSVVLSADAYTAVSETRDHGYPVHQAADQRGDRLGPGHQRRVRADHPGRRLRSAPGPGHLDRVPEPRRVQRGALPPGDADLPRLHQRSVGGDVTRVVPLSPV
jgi:uncharacterized linocin/CFP29 family protein